MFVSMALSILLSVVKNPTKRLAIKRELLTLRDAISAAFPDD